MEVALSTVPDPIPSPCHESQGMQVAVSLWVLCQTFCAMAQIPRDAGVHQPMTTVLPPHPHPCVGCAEGPSQCSGLFPGPHPGVQQLLPHSLILQMWTSAGGLARATPASTAATTFLAASAAPAAPDTGSARTGCPAKVSVSFSSLGEQGGMLPSPCLPQVMSLPSQFPS